MKRLSLFFVIAVLAMLGMISAAFADDYIIGTGTSTQRQPFGAYWGYERSASLYLNSEITATGSITQLAWYVGTAQTTNIPTVIYLKTTTSTSLTAGTWASMISGATTVYTATRTYTPTGWLVIDITDFTYSGDNLLVLCETNYGGSGTGTYPYFRYTTATSRHEYWNADTSAPTGNGTVNSNRPNITISITAGGIANPTAFTATAVSDMQINLGWTRNATPDNVMVARNTTSTFGTPSGTYAVDDPITGGGTVIYNGSGTSLNDDHLDANTQYYYKAWSVNGGTPTYSSGTSANARTMMAPIDHFPWTETFETDSSSRAGWTQVYEAGAADWTFQTGSSGVLLTAYAGTLNARFVGTSGTATPVTKLVSPVFDLSGGSYVLSFWYAQPNWSGDQNTTKVYYRTSPSSSWVEIANYTADASVWTQEPGIVLPNPSATYQIAFEGINNYGYANVVDQVLVDFAPTDPEFAISPASRDFGNQQVGESSAAQVFTIKNNGGGTLTINSVNKAGADAGEFDLTDLNTYNVELGAGEEITVSVVFSPDTVGAKVARLVITHDQSVTPVEVALTGTGLDTTISALPYIQRWDVTSMVEGWVVYNVNADAYTWGLAVDGSDNSAYIRYNTAMAMDDWLISPRILMEGGTQYQVTYDYRCASESYPESIKLAFGNAQNPTAMTTTIADHVDFINTIYTQGSGTFTPATSGYYYLGIHGYSAADMYNIYVDDIRILIPNSNIGEVTASAATATVPVPEILIDGTPTATQIAFDNLTGNPVITVWAEYAPADVTLEDIGLVFTIEGGSMSGIPLVITHNLGFIPHQLIYRIGEGSYITYPEVEGWTETTATFTQPATKSANRLKLLFPDKREDPPLPVELTAFTATMTVDNYVNLSWITQSETGLQGYYIYRSKSEFLDEALLVSPLIDATNSSETQNYVFVDAELFEPGTYYYWLSHTDFDGTMGFHGPITVLYSPNGGVTPPIPVITELRAIYPNPFNPTAYIPFSLAETSAVRFDIYNSRGQLIRAFSMGEKVPGHYQLQWDGKDSGGSECGTGVYFFRMNTNHDSYVRKAVLVK